MADEQEAIASSGLETATAAEVTTEPTIVDEPTRIPGPEEATGEGEGLDNAGGVPKIETFEIDWDDGQKYVIPKALEGGFLKNKDYTTKTQDLSSRGKALDAREAEIEERYKASDEYIEAKAGLKLLDQQLAEYAKLTQEDWDAHQANNPSATESAWRRYQMLKEQRAEAAKNLADKDAERTGKADSELKTRIQETVEHAQKNIPGWTPNTIPELVKFAEEMKVPEAAIKQYWSPTFLDLLHRAHLGAQLLKKQATAPKLPNPGNGPPQPLQKVGGNSNPAAKGDLASMDMESYVAARKKGVGGRALA